MSATGLLRFLEDPQFDLPLARNTDPDTSHGAAASMRGVAGMQRKRIMQFLAQHNPADYNAGEIDVELGWPVSTAGRRMGELRRAGLVCKIEKRGTPVGGRLAYTYVITHEGVLWVLENCNGN